jgi:hypothetical protein
MSGICVSSSHTSRSDEYLAVWVGRPKVFFMLCEPLNKIAIETDKGRTQC